MCVCLHVCVPTGNTCSASLLVRPGGVEQQQPCLSWAVGSSPNLPYQILPFYFPSLTKERRYNFENKQIRVWFSFLNVFCIINASKERKTKQNKTTVFLNPKISFLSKTFKEILCQPLCVASHCFLPLKQSSHLL